MTVATEIVQIANEADLNIVEDKGCIVIKQKLRLFKKPIAGMWIFLVGGVFLMIAPFVKHADSSSKVIGLSLGLFICLLSVVTFIRQAVDFVSIGHASIRLRYNLMLLCIPINEISSIKMTRVIVKPRRSTSSFIQVTHYLQTDNKEINFLTFQMDNLKSGKALILGNYLTQLLNNKIAAIKSPG